MFGFLFRRKNSEKVIGSGSALRKKDVPLPFQSPTRSDSSVSVSHDSAIVCASNVESSGLKPRVTVETEADAVPACPVYKGSKFQNIIDSSGSSDEIFSPALFSASPPPAHLPSLGKTIDFIDPDEEDNGGGPQWKNPLE